MIVVLRDPVERAYSHYKHVVEEHQLSGKSEKHFRKLYQQEMKMIKTCSKFLNNWVEFHDCMNNEIKLFQKSHVVDMDEEEAVNIISLNPWSLSILSRGLYSKQIKYLLSLFDNSNIMFIKSETLFSNPLVIMKRLESFLDISDFKWTDLDTNFKFTQQTLTKSKHNEGTNDLSMETKTELQSFFREFNEELYEVLGKEECFEKWNY
jgi:hypothetical protein